MQSADRLAANQKGRPRKISGGLFDLLSSLKLLANSSTDVVSMHNQLHSVSLPPLRWRSLRVDSDSLSVGGLTRTASDCPKSTFWRERSKYHRTQTASRRDPRDHSLIAVSCRCLQSGKVAHLTSWMEILYLSGS